MFRKISSLLILAAAAFSAAAQDSAMGLAGNERVIGYTTTNEITVKNGGFGQAGTFSLGAYMHASDLKSYAGCRIVGLRVAVGMDLGRSRTFLYSVKGETMSLVHEQRQRLYEGWNRIDFNADGLTIGDDLDLFFGYDYTETAEMVAADQGGIAATGYDEAWATTLFMDNQFYTISEIGKLCVQLIIDVSNMPPYDIAFANFDTGFKYKKTDEPIEVFTTIRNVGRDAIKTLRMAWQYDDLAPQYADLSVNMPSGGTYTWNEPVPPAAPLGIGYHTLKVYPVSADGSEITPSEQNTRTDGMGLYEQYVNRDKALVEIYTNSQNASSIPFNRAISQLADASAIIVKHHAPGTPLATSESANLFNRYCYANNVFTIDRAYFPGEAYIAYSVNDFVGLVPDDMIVSIFQDMIEQEMYFPSFATVKATGSCDANNENLSLEISVDALPEAAAIYGTLAAHVMIVEDEVVSPQANTGIGGRPITNNNYVHTNVVRLNHFGLKGKAVELNDNKGTLSCTIPLNSNWNLSKSRAVVYLTKYIDKDTPDDLKDADIINAVSLPLGAISAVETVGTDSAAEGPSTYYTVGGLPVDGSNLAPGLYIERRPDGSARKILVK